MHCTILDDTAPHDHACADKPPLKIFRDGKKHPGQHYQLPVQSFWKGKLALESDGGQFHKWFSISSGQKLLNESADPPPPRGAFSSELYGLRLEGQPPLQALKSLDLEVLKSAFECYSAVHSFEMHFKDCINGIEHQAAPAQQAAVAAWSCGQPFVKARRKG